MSSMTWRSKYEMKWNLCSYARFGKHSKLPSGRTRSAGEETLYSWKAGCESEGKRNSGLGSWSSSHFICFVSIRFHVNLFNPVKSCSLNNINYGCCIPQRCIAALYCSFFKCLKLLGATLYKYIFLTLFNTFKIQPPLVPPQASH